MEGRPTLGSANRSRPLVIAHRGASGYLPEHTLPAKAMAHAMGADFLEQDIVATRDGELLVMHDTVLDRVSDVAERFPDRARADGRYYCVDFSLAEIKSLRVGERRDKPGSAARYPGRFPLTAGRFEIPTLDEELRFIAGLVRSTGRAVGVYPEIKEPAWHRQQGIDLTPRVLATLAAHGYTEPTSPAFLQCFDPSELARARDELGCRLRLVQLLEGNGQAPPGREQLHEIRRYAEAIGPSLDLLCRRGGRGARPELTTLAEDARATGLLVHAYTLRADDLPAGVTSFEALLELSLVACGVDGVFTDFPDRARDFVDRRFPVRSA